MKLKNQSEAKNQSEVKDQNEVIKIDDDDCNWFRRLSLVKVVKSWS